MNKTVSEKLAEYALSVSASEIPESVRGAARVFLMDFLANALLGYYDRRSRAFRAILPKCDGRSTAIGAFEKTCPAYASLVNSFQGHAQELDDFLPPAYAHVGAVVFPALISFAEEFRLTWMDVLEASIIGYEAAARIGTYLGRRHYERFHATGTVGAIAATLALGKLIGLDEETLANAVGIAGSYASGLWEFIVVGSSIKPLTPAHAVWMAYLSVMMARSGFKGPRTIFEGERGICKSLGGECLHFDFDIDRWYTLENHLKPWPSCRHSHSAIEAALKLRGGIDVGKVKEVVVYTYGEAIKIAELREVSDVDSAKFSIPHLVATALVYGGLTLRDLELSLSDDRVREVRSRVRLEVDEAYDAMYPTHMPARVVAEGLQAEVLDPLGSPANPMGQEDVLNKLRDLDVRISLGREVLGEEVDVAKVYTKV